MVDVIKNKKEDINSKLKDTKTIKKESNGFPILKFDDLVISAEKLKDSRVFQKVVRRKEYEIIIPKDEKEILLRDLKTSSFSRMAERLVQFYVELDPTIDYLAQNYYINEYLKKNNFHLPWIVPIVRDLKKIYKKKLEGPFVLQQDSNQLTEAQKNFNNISNIDQSQVIVENLHNYQSIEPINMINHIGNYVLRVTKDLPEQKDKLIIDHSYLQFRGSYQDWKLVQLIERKKSIRKDVVIGFEKVDRVVGEQLNVIGFAQLPRGYPNLSSTKIQDDWFNHSKIMIKTNGLESILREFIPTIGAILSQKPEELDFSNVTDIRILFKLFAEYGHGLQSLTPANRKQIAELIQSNLDLITKDKYVVTDRLEYPFLEKELIGARGSGILSETVINHPAMIEYRIPLENYRNIFHRYLQIVGRLDNGEIWFSLIGDNGDNQEKKTAISLAVKQYRIIVNNKEIKQELENSYPNLRKRTPEDLSLYENLENPILNILEPNQDKRDRIAWYQYFKKAIPDRREKNFLFHGKTIGCQHDYDRLYQLFEDSSDSYPFGKRYTKIVPHGGVVCDFCGTTLIDENDLIDQGYDIKGQKINTYDNEGLIYETSNIDLFLKKNKTEIVRSGEKLVEQWLDISQKSLSNRQIKIIKYEILKPYEQVILDNKFFHGLQQNPNKLINVKEQQFGVFLVTKYNITDAKQNINIIFLQKLFRFFYSLASIYDIVIQRVAVFMVFLNWHLVSEDPSYIDPNLLLHFYNLEQIGHIFMSYNLNERNMMESLKTQNNRKKGDKESDQFFDIFIEKASPTIPRNVEGSATEMSANEYNKLLKDEYQKYRTRFLYTPGIIGHIFNGNVPLEHEIMRIFSEYKSENKNGQSTLDYLRQIFIKYWNIWLHEHQKEATVIENNAKIALIPQMGILSDQTPRIRPLFDRYLAQKHFILIQKLEQINLDLINENIYNIQGGNSQVGGYGGFCGDDHATGGGEGPGLLLMKKMYLLNKMNCRDWTNVTELDLIGIEEETVRLKQIQVLQEEIRDIENQMKAGNMYRFFWPLAGGFISRNYTPRGYIYFKRINDPPDPMKMKFTQTQINLIEKSIGKKFNSDNYPFEIIPTQIELPERKKTIIKKDDIIARNNILKDVGFVDRIDNWLNKLGEIDYLNDLEKFNKYSYKIINGLLKGTKGCNMKEYPLTSEDLTNHEFDQQYETVIKDAYSKTRLQMINMKKYIITYLRQHILLLSRLDSRQMLIQYGLDRYLELFEYEEFNAAFENFNSDKSEDQVENSGLGKIFTNDQIDNLIIGNLSNYEQQPLIIKDLQTIFLTDIVRHLRMVRNKAGRFIKGKKKLKQDEPDAAQIFVRFIKILFEEIKEQEQIDNVDFNHLEINQIFMYRSMWHKMDVAEKKGELEWKILRYKLRIEEIQIDIASTGEIPVDPLKEEEWDDGELDAENDEDDFNDNDYANV